MKLRNILFLLALAAGNSFAAAVECPSLAEVQSAPPVYATPVCEESEAQNCQDYAVLSMTMHGEKMWVIGSGLFSATNPMMNAEKLLEKGHAPQQTEIAGQSICVYYGINIEEDGRFKFIAAVPYDSMQGEFNAKPFKALLK